MAYSQLGGWFLTVIIPVKGFYILEDCNDYHGYLLKVDEPCHLAGD